MFAFLLMDHASQPPGVLPRTFLNTFSSLLILSAILFLCVNKILPVRHLKTTPETFRKRTNGVH